ncbi:hypothetical protein ACFWM1_21435 [Nocardia sp. NPDC058379]|uniref:hypothetical protein n=1 Tax=unclassified Nocardia TaxID=2637762 RepID=UPI00365BF541
MSDDRSMEDAVSSPNTEITALAQQVATARGKLPLQHDTALYDALSDAEIRAERELAEWIRAQRRKQRRHAVADELAAEQRDRRTGALIRRADEADARWHRKALAARRRVSSADARLAQLYRRAEWSSRALIGVVILGMVWAGVNVQHNLVPSGDMSDPLYWLSFGIEAMISIPIITIMVAATTAARWGRELERGKVLLFELALLGTTVALNAGPHLASGSYGRAAEYAIAPVMVGVVIWLHAWVSARYALLIEGASVELPGEASYSPAERVMSMAGVGSVPASTLEHGAVQGDSRTQAVERETVTAARDVAETSMARPDVDKERASGAMQTSVPESQENSAAQVATAVGSAMSAADTEVRAAREHPAAQDATVVATALGAVDSDAQASQDAALGGSAAQATTVAATTMGAVDSDAQASQNAALDHSAPQATTVAASALGAVGSAAQASQDAALGGSAAQAATEVETVLGDADSGAQASRDAAARVDSTPIETLAGRGQLTHGGRRPSTDKIAAPGTLELIHKAAAEHRRNGDHARVNGATPTLRRIPVTTAAQATAGEATGTDPVPEATAHAGSVARDRNGDTAAPTASVVVHNDPQPPAQPEQLTLTADLEQLPSAASGPGSNQQPAERESTPSADRHRSKSEPQQATSAPAAGRQLTDDFAVSRNQQRAETDQAPVAMRASVDEQTADQVTKSAVAGVAQQQDTTSGANHSPQTDTTPSANDTRQQITKSAASAKQQLAETEAVTPEAESSSQPAPRPIAEKQLTKVAAVAAAPISEQSPEPIELDDEDQHEDDLTDDYDFDDDTEVRALARQIAHRSPLRLTLDQIEEILELTDQSWSARSIGAEVGVSGSTVTNIVEFARKIRQPYAFTG